MLNIKFRIDPNLMARVIISTSKMPTELANYLWNKYRLSYQILQKDLHSTEIDNNIILELSNKNISKLVIPKLIKIYRGYNIVGQKTKIK